MDREQDIPFVYEDGVLKPEGAVDLPIGFRGVAHVSDASASGDSVGSSIQDSAKRRRALEMIKKIGDSGVFNSGGIKLTRDEMHERR